MRILHLVPRYAPATGGIEIYMQKLSEHLVAQGHEIVVATSDSLDYTVLWRGDGRRIQHTQQTINGVDVRYFRTRNLPLSQVTYPAWRLILRALSKQAQGINPAIKLCKFTPYLPDLYHWLDTTPESFDLVAAAGITFESFVMAGSRFAKNRNIPFAVYPFTHLGAGKTAGSDHLSRFYTMPFQNKLVVQADKVFTQTQTSANYYVEKGLPSDHACVIGAGMDPSDAHGGNGRAWRDTHNIPKETPIIFTLSSLNYDKGTPHLVEAVRQLWADGIDVELAIAGTAQPDFQAYFDKLPSDIHGRLHMLGHITHQEKLDAYAAAQIFAMPSRTDSFGIVYLEAWVAGLPVVGAKTWGVMDDVIRDGENGRLVDYGDVQALANVLKELLADGEERDRLAQNGRDFALNNHTWEHKQQITEEVYTALVKK